MRNEPIPQFELSSRAKAGILIEPIGIRGVDEHNIDTPHRDDHGLLMLLTAGQVRLHIDFEEIKLNAPAILLVFPGQVHHVFETKNPEGWIVGFEASGVERSLYDALESFYNGPVGLQKESDIYQQLIKVSLLINGNTTLKSSTFVNQATHALFSGFLNLIAETVCHTEAILKNQTGRRWVISRDFRRLLHHNFKVWKQPAQYAAELAVSTAHLNDVLKSTTGLATSTHIQVRSILEAKRLLHTTELSVKEIGYALGYDEPVYFGKLFKKVSGVSPLQFKKQFRD